MAQMKKEIIENGIHYTLHGDYYFPDLEFPETPRQGIGRYGRMRKTYLEKHRPGLYERLIGSLRPCHGRDAEGKFSADAGFH